MSALLLGLLVCPAPLAVGQAVLVRKPAQNVVEALGKWLGKPGTKEFVENLAGLGGKEAVEALAERTLREGGDEALNRLSRLAQSHGPEVIRAADNAPAIPPVLKALDELPTESVEQAARRLGAGPEGQQLARWVEEGGVSVLKAEVRHPGVGGRLVWRLGDDGHDLAARLSTPQAITVGQHADDIAKLPVDERAGIIALIQYSPERLVSFMAKFVRENPKAVLFTGATTAVVLANSERILGDAEIVFGPDGKPVVVEKPGLLQRMASEVFPVSQISFLAWFVAAAAAIVIVIKTVFHYRRQHLKYRLAETKTTSPSR